MKRFKDFESDNELNESLKIGRHQYNLVKRESDAKKIYVGPDGILGENRTHISWDEIYEFMDQYYM